MPELYAIINREWAEQCGSVKCDIVEFCYLNGYWSWDDTIDPDGNIVDSIAVISRRDLQDACDVLGIEFDVFNY